MSRSAPTQSCSSSRCAASTRSSILACSRSSRARLLVGQLDDVTFQHVRREQNKEADRLSNLGMDEAAAALKAERESRSGGSAAHPQRNLF